MNIQAPTEVPRATLVPEIAESQKEFHISPQRIKKWLYGITGFLLAAHILSFWLLHTLPPQHLTQMLDTHFNLGKEANIPTYFSSAILVFAAVLLFLIHS